MANQKKKRSKKYTGRNAKTTQNVVRIHKSTAVVRSDRMQWFYDRRKIIRTIAIITGVIILMIALIVGFLTS